MKKKLFILTSILLIFIILLALKSSVFEHFDNKKEFKKIVKKLERQYNTDHIKTKCRSEYNECLNSEVARTTLLKLFKNYDISGLMLLKSPKEVVDLRECVMDNYS